MEATENLIEQKLLQFERNFQKKIDLAILPFFVRLDAIEERSSENNGDSRKMDMLEKKLNDQEVAIRQNRVDLSLLKNKAEMAFLELEILKADGRLGSNNLHEIQAAYESQLSPIFDHIKRIDEKMLRIEQNTSVKTNFPTIESMNAALKREMEAMTLGLHAKLKGMKSKIKIIYNKVGHLDGDIRFFEGKLKEKTDLTGIELKINEAKNDLQNFKDEIMHIARLNIELSKALTGKEKVIGLKVYKFACELIQGLFKGERTRLQIFEEMEKVTTLKMEKEMDLDSLDFKKAIEKFLKSKK